MRIILKITKYFFLLSLFAFIFVFISFYSYSKNLTYKIPKNISVEIYDKENNLIAKTNNNSSNSYVEIAAISRNIINAFISIEDKEFYTHKGVNIKRIIGALIADIKSKDFSQGGSTITQQYVKNMFLTSDKTFKRKIDEALIAINLEKNYSKDQILEGYLNTIYFDHGLYGVEDAALFYFNKHASDVTLAEACILAAIPKSPTNYSPIKNKENNDLRKKLILNEMLSDKVISTSEYDIAINEDVKIYGEFDKAKLSKAPYYIDCILKEINTLDLNYTESIKVYTNFDSKLNDIIVTAIEKYYPKNDDIQIALYAMDNNGKVLNCIGGKNYLESTFNRATSSLRQPGSTVKPFLYYAALKNGFNVSNTFYSSKTNFNIDGTIYSPKNFNDKYAEQDISMIYAIAVSDNIYALKTHLFLGTDTLYNTLKDFGISSKLNNNVSLALGTSEVYLDELTTAYCKLASLGKDVNNDYINKITTFNGKILYETKNEHKQKFNIDDCYILSEALTNIFDPNIRINTSPTGSSISTKLSSKYAAKSGSTDFDNWIIGYNNNITLGIWVGYDENKIIDNSKTKFLKYIWAEIMEKYNSDFKNKWYDTPQNCLGIKLNPITGSIPGQNEYSKYLYFKKNNLPLFLLDSY